MHPGAPAEPVLCAWGITTQGSPVLVGLAPGAHGGHDPWAGCLGELVARGLRAPLLVITDGAPGLIDITADPGQLAAEEARCHAEAFADRYGKRYPAAVAWLLASLPELTTFLRFPGEHWQRIHHPARLQEVVDQPVTPAAYHAPSGARVRPLPPKRDATPGEDTQPEAAEKIHASTWTGTQTVVLVAGNLPTMGEADDCSIPAGNRLRRSGLAGPLLGCRFGL